MIEVERPSSGESGARSGGTMDIARISRSIARNAVLSFAARVTSLVGWLLVTPWILRDLGPERFGLWSLLGVVLGIYITFDLGLSGSLTKFVAEFRAARDVAALEGVFTLGAGLYLALSVLGIVLIVLGREGLLSFFRIESPLRDEAGWSLIAAAIAYGVMNLWTLMGSVLTGLHRLDQWNRYSILVTLLQLAGVFVVLGFGWGIRGLVVNTGFGMLVGLLLSWAAASRLEPAIRIAPRSCSMTLWHRLTRYSAAIQLINFGVLMQFQLPKVLFPRFLSLGAAANYELGYRVAFAAWSLPSVLLPPLLPAASHLDASGDRNGIERLYRRASRYLLAIAMPLAAAMVALSSVFYAVWLGPGHSEAARAAQAIGALFWVVIVTSTGCVIARGIGRAWFEARSLALAMGLHLGLSIVLIPRLGFDGGLLSMFVSGMAGALYFMWSFHRAMSWSLLAYAREIAGPPAAISLAAAGIGWWACGLAGADPDSWTRARAIGGLITGGTVIFGLSAILMSATKYVPLSELRHLMELTTGMRLAGKPADGSL